MGNFKYVARDLSGEQHSGMSQAGTKNDVMVGLRKKGLIPVEVRMVNAAKHKNSLLVKRKKIKSIELASFCWQLQAMLEGGVSITSAIETIHEDCENRYFQHILERVGESLEEGEPLSNSIKHFPKVFNRMFCSMVLAGEAGGAMPAAFERLADYYDGKDKLARKVKSAIAYPVFVVGFVILLIVFIMTFIIPRFKSLFEGIGGELPVLTRAFMFGYDTLVAYLPYIFVGFCAGIVGAVYYGKTDKGREFFSKLVLKIPLIGKILSQAFIAMFCKTFSTLLGAGVSVLDALDIMASMNGNTVIKSAFLQAREAIVSGSSISLGMGQSSFFPKMLTKMVQIGEESGSLPPILERTSSYYERKVDSTIATITTVLEPFLIVVVGGIVLGVVLALYLPIFSLSDIKQ